MSGNYLQNNSGGSIGNTRSAIYWLLKLSDEETGIHQILLNTFAIFHIKNKTKANNNRSAARISTLHQFILHQNIWNCSQSSGAAPSQLQLWVRYIRLLWVWETVSVLRGVNLDATEARSQRHCSGMQSISKQLSKTTIIF